MFGSNQHGANAYANVGVDTGVLAASSNKLTIMLYEGAISACRSAMIHMQNKDIANKGAMLSKAIMIIESGLRMSLNKKAGGEIALSLDALYGYISHRLTLANIRNQPELIIEVIKLLSELKSAWEAIEGAPLISQALPATIPRIASQVTANRNIANYAKA